MNARPWFAINARDLLDTRRQGLKPEVPVNVSLIGWVSPNLTLHVREDMPVDRLDWRMLANVEVVVWADTDVPFDRVAAVVIGIARVHPAELVLGLLHEETWHLVDCGSGRHVPAVQDIPARHEFQWQPVNLGGTPMGYRIKAALHKNLQPGTYL